MSAPIEASVWTWRCDGCDNVAIVYTRRGETPDGDGPEGWLTDRGDSHFCETCQLDRVSTRGGPR